MDQSTNSVGGIHDRLLDQMIERIELLNKIGSSLSAQANPLLLLETILDGAQQLTGADAGTVYSFDADKNLLEFAIMRTDSMGTALGGSSGRAVDLPPVPLYRVDGQPNRQSVVACAVLEQRAVNVADAYQERGFDFSGTREFDQRTGYRSRSMLTIPMRNHEDEIIGVLQLINAQGGNGTVIPFSAFAQRLVESVASQAATAWTRHCLMRDMESLFESFVRMIAEAIDQKSPHTGAHCRRVPEIAMSLAEACCLVEDGPLGDFDMSERDRYELHIAALLHDCGKIITPDWVMDKATKLQLPRDGIETIAVRFAVLRQQAEITKLQALAAGTSPEDAERAYATTVAELDTDLAFLRRANQGSEFMTDIDQQRVRAMASRQWLDETGQQRPLLTDQEVEHLTITRGTLNQSERQIIEQHIVATIAMLEQLPYPRHLRRIPEFAGGHHERMDGKGYPRGLTREQMSWQARMMGLADVFEALTAKDRPYKKPMPISQALTILGRMAEDGHIDSDLFEVFVSQGVWRAYAQSHMDPAQIDAVEIDRLPGRAIGAAGRR